VGEDLGLQDVDAGVDRVAEDLTPARLLEEPLDAPILTGDHDPELEGVLGALEDDRGRSLLLAVELHRRGQVEVGDVIAGDDQEGVVEEVLGVLDASRRAERLVLRGVRERHAEVRSIAEVMADDAREELDGGHDLGDAVLPEEQQDVLHHGPAHDGQHRLRLIGGEGAQPGALAPAHDHAFHRG
jgi:hypothetical protein